MSFNDETINPNSFKSEYVELLYELGREQHSPITSLRILGLDLKIIRFYTAISRSAKVKKLSTPSANPILSDGFGFSTFVLKKVWASENTASSSGQSILGSIKTQG